ncbi:MAG: efflux RND transporter periplasmic adaptor subunit [Hyphomicrobiales bacterium]
MKLRFAIALLVIAGLLGGLSYFQFVVKPKMVSQYFAAVPKPTLSVNAVLARKEQWGEVLHSIGTIHAVQGIDVAPSVAGLVTEILFKSGDVVSEGAKLIQLDDSTERADLKNHQASLKKAQLSWNRQKALFKNKAVSQALLDDARATRDEAAATVERDLAILEKTAIKAPFSGHLGIRKVDIGQYVTAGAAIASLQMIDPIYTDFSLPERYVAQARPGQTVTITVDAWPDVVFTGRVDALDSRIDGKTRDLLIRARFDNPEGKLLPGMFANVAVAVGSPEPVVIVPRTAITYSLYGDSVYVLTPARDSTISQGESQHQLYTVHRRFIETREVRQDNVAITRGVEPGDMIVTSGGIDLKNDMSVVIDKTGGLKPPATMPTQ